MRIPPGSQLVFQQIVTDATPTTLFSDPRFNDWLGRGNELSVFAVADRVSASGSLTVRLQDTADEETLWVDSFGADGGEGSTYAISTALTTSGLAINGSDSEAFRGYPALGFRRLGVDVSFGGFPGSARVRVWVAARGPYRVFHRLLFEERLDGSGALHTQHEACAGLAGADKLAIATLAEEVAGTATLTVQMEESPNGRTWQDVPGAQWNGSIGSGQLAIAGMLTDTLPPSGLVRFRLQLGGTSPVATVRLWATGRDVHPG